MEEQAYVGWDDPYLFISYSSKDAETVMSVLALLRQNHFRFWYDSGIPSGEIFAETLAERIERCAQVLVFLSENAVRSRYVLREIQYAIDQDKNIIVIYLDHTKLDRKLAFLLGCIHAIRLEDENFRTLLFRSISKEAMIQETPDPAVREAADDARRRCEEQYRILSPLGKGGIGTVYLAEHRRTGRKAVVKQGRKDDTYRGRLTDGFFRTECRILSLLQCPFIPQLLDYFDDAGSVYLVESYIPGRSLAELMRQPGGFSEQEAVDVGLKLLRVMAYFDDRSVQVVHKDIKPTNILISDRGDVYVIDFGAGQITDLAQGWRKEVFAATPGFAAPEQYGGSVDWRADQYGVGRTLARLLTCGREKGTPQQNLPIRAYDPSLNPVLEQVILKMTAASPRQRYDSVESASDALAGALRATREERLAALAESDRRLQALRESPPEPLERISDQRLESLIMDTELLNEPSSPAAAVNMPPAPPFWDPEMADTVPPQGYGAQEPAADELTLAAFDGSPNDGETVPIFGNPADPV